MTHTSNNQLKIITYADLMELKPRDIAIMYASYYGSGWSGTILDILHAESLPAPGRLRIALRDDLTPPQPLYSFVVWCAEQILTQLDTPPPQSLQALETARKWLEGNATDTALNTAKVAAALQASRIAQDLYQQPSLDCLKAADAAYAAAYAVHNSPVGRAFVVALATMDSPHAVLIEQLIKTIEHYC